MKVLLLQDIRHLGRKGEIRDASEGYARNFLVPKKLAVPATEAVVRAAAAAEAQKEQHAATERQQHTEAARKMKDITLSFKMKMGERGKAFGSVGSAKITEALKHHGITAESAWITLEEPIKTSGEHTVSVAFPHGIEGRIKIIVEPE